MADRFHRIGLELLKEACRGIQTPRLIVEQLNAKIHLKKGEAILHAALQCHAHIVSRVLAIHIGIAVNTHTVAIFTAKQLVHGNIVKLADDIKKRDLHA